MPLVWPPSLRCWCSGPCATPPGKADAKRAFVEREDPSPAEDDSE